MSERKQIFDLIPKVMKDIGVVGKDRKNASQGYQFRGIDDMYNAVQPVLIRHGVFIVPTVLEQHREERQTAKGGNLIYTVLTVRHTLYAPDGSSVDAVTVGEAMDSGDKSANKAMSAAMKYALIEVFSIPTEGDNDTENQSPEPMPQQPAGPNGTAGGDAIANDKVFKPQLAKAFKSRGFTTQQMKDAMPEILKLYKVGSIEELNPTQRHSVLRGIATGDADRFKDSNQGKAA